MSENPLLLASSSPYRRELMERLQLPFSSTSPDIDETPGAGEAAEDLAVRLATSKARAAASEFPGYWIIGSDQVAALADGSLLSKPGSYENARRQLERSSGQRVNFFTGLTLLDADSGKLQTCCELFTVHFRELNADEVAAYLRKEAPYDCAGSFKMEGLGITLFRELQGRAPNSLIGLPLIALCTMLTTWGRNPLLEP